MEYYLLYISELTGVPNEFIGITPYEATMRTLLHQFNVRHEDCKGYNKTDHECPACDRRFVVDTVKEVHR